MHHRDVNNDVVDLQVTDTIPQFQGLLVDTLFGDVLFGCSLCSKVEIPSVDASVKITDTNAFEQLPRSLEFLSNWLLSIVGKRAYETRTGA